MYILRPIQFNYGHTPYNLNLIHHPDGKRLSAAPNASRQSVTTYSIHSSEGDLGIGIKLYIVKVTLTNIIIVPFSHPGTKK